MSSANNIQYRLTIQTYNIDLQGWAECPLFAEDVCLLQRVDTLLLLVSRWTGCLEPDAKVRFLVPGLNYSRLHSIHFLKDLFKYVLSFSFAWKALYADMVRSLNLLPLSITLVNRLIQMPPIIYEKLEIFKITTIPWSSQSHSPWTNWAKWKLRTNVTHFRPEWSTFPGTFVLMAYPHQLSVLCWKMPSPFICLSGL